MFTEPATIDTQTATIHTLKIGTQQITLTTAKQLDQVPFEQLDAFGRVKLPGLDGLTFIGRHHTTGTLALATMHPRHFPNPEEFRHWRDNVAPGYPMIILAGRR